MSVYVPESRGFTLRKHSSHKEFEAVAWTGDWADVDHVLGGAYSALAKEVDDFLP